MKPERQEIDRLRKEGAKLKVERDILKLTGLISLPAGATFDRACRLEYPRGRAIGRLFAWVAARRCESQRRKRCRLDSEASHSFPICWPILLRARCGVSDQGLASPRSSSRNGSPKTFFPCEQVRIPRDPRKLRATVLHMRSGSGECGPIVPGLFDCHRGREGRGPRHAKRNTIMATIGSFTASDIFHRFDPHADA